MRYAVGGAKREGTQKLGTRPFLPENPEPGTVGGGQFQPGTLNPEPETKNLPPGAAGR